MKYVYEMNRDGEGWRTTSATVVRRLVSRSVERGTLTRALSEESRAAVANAMLHNARHLGRTIHVRDDSGREVAIEVTQRRS